MKNQASPQSHETKPDLLNGLWNHAAILGFFRREAERCRRTGSPLGVLIGDMDHLTRINKVHGPVVGDLVLEEVAGRLLSSVRPYDWIGRYGGATFLILAPGCPPPDVWRLGERLRAAIGDTPIAAPSGPLVVTASFGVAAWSATRNVPMDGDALLRACAAALTESKRSGRNKVSFAPWQEYRQTMPSGQSHEQVAVERHSSPSGSKRGPISFGEQLTDAK